MNLPTEIEFGTLGNIKYIYNATGQKVSKIVSENSVITTHHYQSGYQYENGNLQFFPHAEGYVNVVSGAVPTYNYVYQYKDHLGNNRLSYATTTQASQTQLTILEESHYYPFGLKHAPYNNNQYQFIPPANGNNVALLPAGQNGNYQYKYNGKEYQDELGLNMYDYGARNYDHGIGRWMNIDPLAEHYYGINPYAYVFNNPIELFDPDGMRVRYVREEGLSRREFRQSKREFKAKNRQLMKDSETHINNFNKLRSSKNVHEISFNRGKGSSVEIKKGEKQNRKEGNNSTFKVDLDQKGSENEFVIAHETGHAVDIDKGNFSPFDAEGVSISNSHDQNMDIVAETRNKNSDYNEESASHVENVVRGEVSASRGVQIPLREFYYNTQEYYDRITKKIKEKSEKKQLKTIRDWYDYYKR